MASSYRQQLIEEHELGWRAAGAIARESEGPRWMRMHILYMRFGCPNELREDPKSLQERAPHLIF